MGSGKSTVADMISAMVPGTVVVDADQISRNMLAVGGSAFDDVVAEFGPAIVAKDGSIDRGRLAALVFGDTPEAGRLRQRLNALVHPKVRAEEVEKCRAALADGAPLVVLMVPLLFENAMQDMADRTMLVTLGDETERARRLAARSGYSADDTRRRLASQMPDERKRELADVTIDNGGTPAATETAVRRALSAFGVATV